MNCPKCDHRMQERPIQSMFDRSIFICNICSESIDPQLQDYAKPNSTESEIAVQAVNDFVSKLGNIDLILKILIWGPNITGSSDSLLAKKRLEIKEALIEMGHDARFSEELVDKFQEPGMTLHHNEQKQIRRWANVLVVLTSRDTSGAWQELNGHCVAIGKKGLIWTTEKALSSYSRGILDRLKDQGSHIELYETKEIKPCFLKTATQTWITVKEQSIKCIKEEMEIGAEELSNYGL